MMVCSSFTTRPYRFTGKSDYQGFMNHDYLTPLVDRRVREKLEENGFIAPEAPRSIYHVDKLYQALDKYSPTNRPRVNTNDHFIRKGASLAYTCFAWRKNMPKLSIMPLTLSSVREVTTNTTGSPGLTFYGKRKADVMDVALEDAKLILSGDKTAPPCLAFKRTQFNEKTRLVWGYPYSMTVIEGLLARPLIQFFLSDSTPMCIGDSSLHIGTSLRRSAYQYMFAYSIDMSSFDSSISASLIHLAFSVLKTWFNLQDIEPTTGLTVGEIFKVIEKYFVCTPIVMPDGNLYTGKRHGVPSGSYFTQMIDSIVNTIIAGAVDEYFHLHIDKSSILVLGDDLLFWSNRDVQLDDIAEFIVSKIHITAHGCEKSGKYSMFDTIHFLGRDWKDGVPDLDLDEILKRMVYPEGFRQYSDDPVEAEGQVYNLLHSYTAVYQTAWQVVRKCYPLLDRRMSDPFQMDRKLPRTVDAVNPMYLSGLQRYKFKYIIRDDRSFLQSAGTLLWL